MALLLVAVVIIFLASYVIAKHTSDDERDATPPHNEVPATSAGRGNYPYPRVPRVLAGGIELVDLRVVPLAQRRAGFRCVGEQLRGTSPYVARCFIVDAATMEEWLKLDGFVALLVGEQLKCAANATKIFVHAPGFRELTAADNELLASIGLDYAIALTHVEPTHTIDLFANATAAPPPEWQETHDKRPNPGSQCWGVSLHHTDLITQIAPYAFIDLRRATAELRTSPAFVTTIATLIETAIASPTFKPTEIIWVLGPWILDEWRDQPDAARRLVELAAPLRRFGPQRLVLTDSPPAENAQVAQNPIVKQLDQSGFRPIDSRFAWKTKSGLTFSVDPMTALEDSYGMVGWEIDARVGAPS